MSVNQEANAGAEQVAAGQAVNQALSDLQIGGDAARLVNVGTIYTGPVTVHIHIHMVESK